MGDDPDGSGGGYIALSGRGSERRRYWRWSSKMAIWNGRRKVRLVRELWDKTEPGDQQWNTTPIQLFVNADTPSYNPLTISARVTG
ncbi:hypothetical protein AU210_012450 [Fusarium oxysporum f. sp. radicis-cucumerinum]|uniref:Uncharacterized protein n=1 Tax=Fusarium oxysporum f. sp. radicis-cucumerinum TaxID=327505 RepID=A0A2H3G5L2_FUSOX|nr:hypothetical protein AU210_012450 [Fusarium oxysporum f. sp. radicis-cucumerinum]